MMAAVAMRGRAPRVDLVLCTLFALGVVLQNLEVVSLGSEYQPWVYAAVLPYAFVLAMFNNPDISRSRLLATLAFGLIALLLLLVVVANANLVPAKDVLRMLALPVVAMATWIYLRRLPGSAVRIVVFIHVAVLVAGLTVPGIARAVTGIVGARGQAYYDGWNSYFYSEPSYAALSFLFLAFFSARDGRFRLIDAFALSALSVSTLSVTGFIGAAVMMSTLVWQKSRVLLVAIAAGLVLVVLSLRFVPSDTSILALQRLAMIAEAMDALSGLSAQGILFALNAVEPSGMWRILTNLYSISCVSGYPAGLGSTDMAAALWESRCSPSLASVVAQNEIYLQLNPGSTASSVFANLTLFGGIPGAVIGSALVAVQLAAFRDANTRAMFPLALTCVLFFVVWQSAWAAPTASLMIAAGYARLGRRIEEPAAAVLEE
jgi:hypothetical protein